MFARSLRLIHTCGRLSVLAARPVKLNAAIPYNYPPVFRGSSLFSTESKASPAEISKFLSENKIQVENVEPTLLKSPKDSTLPEFVGSFFARQNFSELTPIQAIGWPIVMSGRDFIGVAETGSGKTLSFLVPAISMIEKELQQNPGQHVPRAIIIAPTRELAQQVNEVAKSLAMDNRGFRSACFYGGSSMVQNFMTISAGVDLVIGTPGRLKHLTEEGHLRLDQCKFLVLDEADRMLDMGFKNDLDAICSTLQSSRQTVLWSATWPKEVSILAQKITNNPAKITIGSSELSCNKRIEQSFIFTDHSMRFNKTLETLNKVRQENNNQLPLTIIFVNTKMGAETLKNQLYNQGIQARAVHGDVVQGVRDSMLAAFRRGEFKVLIATDVYARGIDVKEIKCVINYDFPPEFSNYVHRIGRTARGSEGTGKSITILTPNDESIYGNLATLLEKSGCEVPPELKSFSGNGYSNLFGFVRRPNARAGGSSFGGRGGFGGDSGSSFGSRGGFGGDSGSSFGSRGGFGGDSFGSRKSFGGDSGSSFGSRGGFGGDSGSSFGGSRGGFGGDSGSSFGSRGGFGGDSFGSRKSFGDDSGSSFGSRKSFGGDDSFGSPKSFGGNDSFGSRKSFGGDDSFGSRKSFGGDDTFGSRKSFGGNDTFGSGNSFGGGNSFGSSNKKSDSDFDFDFSGGRNKGSRNEESFNDEPIKASN